MYAGMCAPVLYFGIIDCKVISQISFHGSAAGRVKRSSSGSRGAHCVCRCGYHGVRVEHRWTRQNKTADGSDFCYLSGIAPEEMEPHSGDGTGRCHAGDLRIYNDVDGNIDR